MGVRVQRDTDVGMAHEILQRLGIRAGFSHGRTKRVSAYMGRHLRHRFRMHLDELIPDAPEAVGPVLAGQRHPVPVYEHKPALAVVVPNLVQL